MFQIVINYCDAVRIYGRLLGQGSRLCIHTQPHLLFKFRLSDALTNIYSPSILHQSWRLSSAAIARVMRSLSFLAGEVGPPCPDIAL